MCGLIDLFVVFVIEQGPATLAALTSQIYHGTAPPTLPAWRPQLSEHIT